jgi:hypothetical protein
MLSSGQIVGHNFHSLGAASCPSMSSDAANFSHRGLPKWPVEQYPEICPNWTEWGNSPTSRDDRDRGRQFFRQREPASIWRRISNPLSVIRRGPRFSSKRQIAATASGSSFADDGLIPTGRSALRTWAHLREDAAKSDEGRNLGRLPAPTLSRLDQIPSIGNKRRR